VKNNKYQSYVSNGGGHLHGADAETKGQKIMPGKRTKLRHDPFPESAEAGAERLVAEGLGQAGWRESDLRLRRKGDGVKVELARRLRRETTQGWQWIATRLQMGHWRTAANAIRRQRS
jgi:hypothetical protein